jgi:UDP-2,3-diacylglucosamine pyrophosphatase LpxH
MTSVVAVAVSPSRRILVTALSREVRKLRPSHHDPGVRMRPAASAAVPLPFPPPPARRAAFLSDIHLGSAHCHAAELAVFLDSLRCDRLYLVGDIVDLWWLSRRRAHWQASHQRVVEALHALRRAGTEIVYIPGNHDRPMRSFCGLALPAMRVRRRAIHATADGRRLLVVHGDDFDAATQFGNLQERFGDWLYYRILTGNILLNRMRRRFGMRYWSLAEFLKRQSEVAERYIERYRQAGLAEASRRGLDGIVCGHIHRAALEVRRGLVYANDGDWVESLTALVEDHDGTLRLLSHTHATIARLGPRPQATPISDKPLAA